MQTAIQFKDISKKYNLGMTRTSLLTYLSRSVRQMFGPNGHKASAGDQTLWALQNVSFELGRGQSLALIGKNGAGKSTILKLLANVIRPTSGEIHINGRMSALLELGTGFHPDLTGRENVYLNGTILGLKRDEIARRFDEIISFSEIERFIDTPVKRYSSGMLVRLGFAVAACIEPEVLLVDEVLAVGDASFRQKCLHRIQSLVDNGTSIIFVSHSLSMVQAICPNSLYLVDGQIKSRGTTNDIITMYEKDLLEERAHKFEESIQQKDDLTTEVQITRIEMFSADGLTASEFRSDQAAEIRIYYEVNQAAKVATAIVRIVRTDGVTCCMMHTALDNFNVMLHEGRGVISVIMDPLQLVTGTYVLEVTLTDQTGSLSLASKTSKNFFVSGFSKGHSEYFGVFEPRKQWGHYLLKEDGLDMTGNPANRSASSIQTTLL
jgi:lipopolysaccharide transport system ATP-binding protein